MRTGVNGEPRTGDGRLAGGRIQAGRKCGPSRPAERLGRRCGRPSPANGAAPQDTPLIPGLACAASRADALRPPAAVTQLPVTAATAALADGRRLPAAGHRTPALPVPLFRTPASGPPIWS